MQKPPKLDHEGTVVKWLFENHYVNLSNMANILDVSRSTINWWFNSEQIQLKQLIKIGKVMKVRMGDYFPRLRTELNDALDPYLSVAENAEALKAAEAQLREKDIIIGGLKTEVTTMREVIDTKNQLIDQLQTQLEKLEKKK